MNLSYIYQLGQRTIGDVHEYDPRFKQYYEKEPIEGIVLNRVINLVSRRLFIEKKDIISKSRKKELVDARKIIIALTKKHAPSITLGYLGYKLGKRDHSTVIHNAEKADDHIITELKFKKIIDELNKELSTYPKLKITKTYTGLSQGEQSMVRGYFSLKYGVQKKFIGSILTNVDPTVYKKDVMMLVSDAYEDLLMRKINEKAWNGY